MTIIFFHGLISSVKTYYNKYNYFIKQLEQIDVVFIPEITYNNILYYSKKKDSKLMYKPVNKLDYNDFFLDRYIKKLYNNMNKSIYKPPYIIMAHSHGIYYACEFARQYKKEIKYIISLDGSWISTKLNKQRLSNWANQGKIIKQIDNQKTLNTILDKIKNKKDNTKYIHMIFYYVRALHTKFCIKYNYEKINIPLITFRDFNLDFKYDMIKRNDNNNKHQENNNNNALIENKILSKYKNHIIYILLDATHVVWAKDNYKDIIIKVLQFL
jgi:hypothetical protein